MPKLSYPLSCNTPLINTDVVVTIVPAEAMVDVAPMTSLREFFAEIDARPLTIPRSREEIEAQIADERDSWD